jgi:hypothetical protein
MNSMNFSTETREIKDVKRVLLKDYGHLFISQGEEESLRIEGEDGSIKPGALSPVPSKAVS